MDIIEKIKDRRKELKLTQKQIAEIISEFSPISQAAYAKIESGATVGISIEYGKGIAKALGVSFNELFEIEVTTIGSKEESLLADIEKLKEENVKLKLELLDDKRKILDFLSSNDLLISTAAKLYYDEKPPVKYDLDDMDSIIKEMQKRPYDLKDKESMIKYIFERLEEIESRKTE